MRQSSDFRFSRRVAIAVWLAALPLAVAQDSDAPAPPPPPGLQLRSVSGYAVYYSNTLPNNGGFQPGLPNLLSDVGGGAAADIGWSRFGERTNALFTFTPSYTGRVRYSGWNAFNQAASLNIVRKLAPTWTLTVSGAADLSSVDRFLFAPTSFSSAAAVPATLNDFASAVLTGRFTDPRLVPALGGAQLSESPLRALLYGDRMLNYAAQASLAYSYSPRFSITVTAGGTRSEHVSENAELTARSNYLLGNTTSGFANVSFSYSLSPHTVIGGSIGSARVFSSLQDAYTTTVIGGSIGSARVFSPLQDAYTTTSVGSIGRTLGTRWFVHAQAGAGVMTPVRQLPYPISTRPRPAARGSIGFKTFSHTLLGSVVRTVSDSYGLGSATSSSATASWRWKRPGRDWWLTSSMGWQRLEGSLLGNTSGWRATGGVGRAVGQMTFVVEYAWLNYSGPQQRTVYDLSQSAVRVSMSWNPHAPRR